MSSSSDDEFLGDGYSGSDWPELMDRINSADNKKSMKFIFNHDSFMSLEERLSLSVQSLENHAFNIIRLSHLVKLRMDVALDKRVKGKTNNYFSFTLEDAKMLEGCAEYYEHIMKNVELLDEKLVENVKRNMTDVYGTLGKIYYCLWLDEYSIVAFRNCKNLLDEILQQNSIPSPNHQELIFECLLSKIIGELNSTNPKSESLIESMDNYVETYGDRATKDYVNMSDTEFVKTISQQTNCDMQTIKKILQFSKIKYFKSILNDEALVSSIINGIDFIKRQTNHPLTVDQLEFHFGMDEFHSRVGAILTNMNNQSACRYYNHSLSIRKTFFIRTMMNRIIDFQNSGMDGGDEKLLLFAMYYFIFSVLDTFKFSPLPSIIMTKEPFIYIDHLLIVLNLDMEKNFSSSSEVFISNIKEGAEKLDQTKLVEYKNTCLKLLLEAFSKDESKQEDLQIILMLEAKNEEEKYLSLQILPISPNYNNLCDIVLCSQE